MPTDAMMVTLIWARDKRYGTIDSAIPILTHALPSKTDAMSRAVAWAPDPLSARLTCPARLTEAGAETAGTMS